MTSAEVTARKIINRAEDFVDEVIDGILLAHPGALVAATPDRRSLVRGDAPVPGRVGIVTGGGSGHLPLFLGYVGRGLASGVAVGNVFSSPSSAQVLAATRAVDGGAGVLYLYGNYGGDIYNFDIAGDLAAVAGIETATVLGTDDIASAPADRAATRRGVAGLFFAYKTAGAAAEAGADLAGVTRVAQLTVDRTRTMGVGLSPTILPTTGEPTFTLDPGEMEIGVGIHGEPGRYRGPIESADAITDRFLADIPTELGLTAGSSVAVMVNGLGATPLEELYLVYRRAHQVLTGLGVEIHRGYVGEYATSLEMAGVSLSVLALDEELTGLLDADAASPFFRQGAAEPLVPAARPTTELAGERAEPVRRLGTVPPLRGVVLAVADAMPAHADELRDLDAALGDGDLGITVSSGAAAVARAVRALPEDTHPADLLRVAGTSFAAANPSTFAALFGTGLLAAAATAEDLDRIDTAAVIALGRAALERIAERGGARRGDKTMIDALAAALDAADGIADATEAADAAAVAARSAVADGAEKASARGRAAWLGERSVGLADPGSVAIARLVEELAATIGPRRRS